MKKIKHISEFLKIYENNNNLLFKNETKLKNELMFDKDFAKGDVHQGLVNIFYNNWKNDYDSTLEWVDETYGKLALFCMYLGSYNGQVCNGGHSQYFGNGYASLESRGFSGNYTDIDKHDNFVDLFKKLNFNNILPLGKTVYNIISEFNLDLVEETEDCGSCNGTGQEECYECGGRCRVDCPECGGDGEYGDGEECGECDGNGQIDCPECDGEGDHRCDDCNGTGGYDTGHDMPDTSTWELLDKRWYKINEKFLDEFDAYLKSLTLDGTKIDKLVELSKNTQKFNI